jgi:hypothetical protein
VSISPLASIAESVCVSPIGSTLMCDAELPVSVQFSVATGSLPRRASSRSVCEVCLPQK